MTLRDKFIADVAARMPVSINGIAPNTIHLPSDDPEKSVVFALYFIRAFRPDGAAIDPQPPFTEMHHNWQQRAIHVFASDYELKQAHSRGINLASGRLSRALVEAMSDTQFFGVAA